MSLDNWIAESNKCLNAVASDDDHRRKFEQGAWWSAYHLSGDLPWKTFQELRNKLVEVSNKIDSTAFQFVERHCRQEENTSVIAGWIPSANTCTYWRYSFDGFAFCTSTFTEDVIESHSGQTLALNRPVYQANELLRHIQAMCEATSKVVLQMGWRGLEGRQPFDKASNYHSPNRFVSDKINSEPQQTDGESLAKSDLVSLIFAATGPLYRAASVSHVDQNLVRRWLLELR